MYKVTNILQANIRAKGQELFAECRKLGVTIMHDTFETTETGRAVPKVDETKQSARLEQFATLKWVAPIDPFNPGIPDSDLKALEKVEKIEEYFKIVDSNAIGFERLRPNESVELRHEIRIVEALIQSAHRDKIRIEDTETGDVIWEPATRKAEREYIVVNFEGKKVKEKFEVTEVYNKIHPEGKIEIYYPPIKEDKTTKSVKSQELDLDKIKEQVNQA
jgi:hypothetical protein